MLEFKVNLKNSKTQLRNPDHSENQKHNNMGLFMECEALTPNSSCIKLLRRKFRLYFLRIEWLMKLLKLWLKCMLSHQDMHAKTQNNEKSHAIQLSC